MKPPRFQRSTTRKRKFIISLIVLAFMMAGFGLGIQQKPPLAIFYSQSTAIYAQGGELLRLTLAADQQYRLWLPLGQIPASLQEATLLYEDQGFYRHPGINPLALLRSAWKTYIQGQRQGASTITMQLARQRYRLNSRQLLGKIQQILAALWLELNYSKPEILEAYLNTAPYGGNISGVAAASLVYFHKPVSQLTLAETLSLAVIPQNPVKRAPNKAKTSLLSARQRLWQRWLPQHPEHQHYASDFALPLATFKISDKPFIAPHLTDWLLQHYPTEHSLTSSIDLPVQETVKHMMDIYVTQNRSLGLRNSAALLLDTHTMQAKAMVGSANFWDKAMAGQVNGVLAKRSPGSTLKPFIYALALDQGLIHPHSLLVDTPNAFGAFNPENFDGRFLGPLTAQDALIRSRNIPALNLAAKLAQPNLYGFLKQAGISGLADEKHYGLSLALGGAETTMAELVQLYAMLANAGKLHALQYLDGQSLADTGHGPQLLSPAAAYITLDMLSFNIRPDSKRPAWPKVAWKTGTSWGFKDAWAIGVVGHYVLAVWVGNFSNTGNTAYIGVQSAAPLFFNIIDSLRARQLLAGLTDPVPGQKPDSVSQVDICAASGDFPNADCPALAKTWFIPGKSPIKTSSLHRAVYFDAISSEVVCPNTPQSRKEVYEFWPSDLAKLFAEAGLPRRLAPALPSCYTDSNQQAPEIVSPSFGGVYKLSTKAKTTIGLRANSLSNSDIFWFADKNFLGKSKASEVFSWLPHYPARYLLRAVDSQGRAASREVTVEFSQ